MNPTVTSTDTQGAIRVVSQQRDPQTYAVIGAAMAVHKELGSGFLERVYQEALMLELCDRGIAFGREVEVNVHYKGQLLTCGYRADLICFPDDMPVLVELKACERLTQAHRAQVIHYMKATQIQRALLINFGGPSLQFELGPGMGPNDLAPAQIRSSKQNHLRLSAESAANERT